MQSDSNAGLIETEAIIVGGGPAGLAAAIALRQRGIDCVVVEARAPGIDKACGEGLMPDSQAVLAQLGIRLSVADGQPFSGIHFINAEHSVAADFTDGKGLGVRRPHLHALLAARATELGARLMWESHLKLPPPLELKPSSMASKPSLATVNGKALRYRWLIGADGQASTVRRLAGLDRAKKRSLRYGFRTHYRVDVENNFDRVEVHWAPCGQLYLTPVAPDCVCVVYLSRDPRRGKTDVLADFPEVARRLHGPYGMEVVSRQRGAVSATCRLRSVATGHVALIGDASGSVDSITGEGLAVSFRQAQALADAIAEGSLAPYERAHREIARLPHAMGALMLALDRWPRMEARAMAALAATPALFSQLLQAHTGAASLASVLLRYGPRFVWEFLTAGMIEQQSESELVSTMSTM